MLGYTQTKIFEYGQKYLTAFIIIFPYFELVDGLGKSLNFEFRIRKGRGVDPTKYWEKNKEALEAFWIVNTK